MNRTTLTLALAAILSAPLSTTASADTVLDGTTDGGAFFRIVVPDVWNGDLVIWNHGFSLSPLGPVSDLGPLAPVQLAQGYAVAASSYQQIGWALYKTKNDMQNMVDVFKANFGTPGEVILFGASLGGIVTAQLLEKGNLGNVTGAYPICGALAGSRSWDGAIDLRLVYDAICSGVPGAAIPGGGTGLPEHFSTSSFGQTEFGFALQACFGIFVPPAFRTGAQQARLDLFLDETDLPENFVVTDMGFAVFAISDLIFDPAKLDGKQGFGNVGVPYEDAGIDASIERVAVHPGGANRHRKNFTPKGSVGDTKIVSIHTDGDGLVIVEHEKEYQDVVPASKLTVGIVNEAGNTHCAFTGAELVGGWEALRGWLAGAPQPSVATLQGTCLALEGAFGGPCRYDPGFVIPDMDGRIAPR